MFFFTGAAAISIYKIAFKQFPSKAHVNIITLIMLLAMFLNI